MAASGAAVAPERRRGPAPGEAEGPTPAETEAVAWAQVVEASQRRLYAGARALAAWARDPGQAPPTPKGDERTNVIDQGEARTYALGGDALQRLFGLLEACRLEGSATHWSERQGTLAVPRTGLMLDYDLRTTERRPALAARHYNQLAAALALALQRDIDFAAQAPCPPGAGGRRAEEFRFHVAFIVRPEASPLQAPAAEPGDAAPQLYKYGLHVLVPGVRLGRAYKKHLLRQFAADPMAAKVLRDLGVAGPPADCLDQNSASVPVLFFGSCKKGGRPYTLGAVLEVTLDLSLEAPGTPPGGGAGGGGGGGAGGPAWMTPPVIRALDAKELAGYNLCAELSLVAEADYASGALGAAGAAAAGGDGHPARSAPLVAKRDYEPRPGVAAAAQAWAERAAGDAVPADELLLAEHSLSALALHDAEARHLHALLGLLGGAFLTDRNRWRDVVYALAGTNAAYKPLAVWFSQRCRHRTRDAARTDDLDALWADAVARRGAPPEAGGGARPLTLRSIAYWAREADPGRYAEVMERSYFTTLTSFVYEFGGKLQHYMVAKVLQAMLGSKFVVDIDAGPRGSAAYCWFEFVVPGEAMRPGEVWKWRKEVEPDAVHIYISESLVRVFGQIGEHIEERRAGAADEAQGKYYRDLGRAFAASKGALYQDAFKCGIVRQGAYLFRRRGFAEQLDRLPFLFGVGNGVLRIGPRVELIDHFHEYPISRFTTTAFRRFDPADPDPWSRLVLEAVEAIIVEPDAREWILFHTAQGLDGRPKEGKLLLWDGGGRNGKTAFLRWAAKALGPYADKFNIQLMCCEREDADRPNSAIMRFKGLRWAYAEESNKAQSLNVARMKELVNPGEVSARDLNSRQETFSLAANFVAASQYGFIVNTTDHGTWRRLRNYRSKVTFCRRPDPANPLEKRVDPRYVETFPDDPQWRAAFLGILVHYYERLQLEFGGCLENVRAPTIERESEAFRKEQDSLHRWICETILVSPNHPGEYGLGLLGGRFVDWYFLNVERKRLVSSEVIKELANSAICPYLRPALNRTLVLRGCRVLGEGEGAPREGEEWFGEAQMRGTRSAREWAEACAEADAELALGVASGAASGGATGVASPSGAGAPPPRGDWWAPRPIRAAAPGAENGRDGGREAKGAPDEMRGIHGLLFPGDDAALVRAGRPAPLLPATAATPHDFELDLEREAAALLAESRTLLSLDDVYEEGSGNGDGVGGDDSDGGGGGDGDGAGGGSGDDDGRPMAHIHF